MRVYIVGPMRGLPEWNFPAFDQAAAEWRADGHEVFSPAEMCRGLRYDHFDDGRAGPDTAEGRDHMSHVLMSDLLAISLCGGLVLLSRWWHSSGSTVEVAYGQCLGLRLFDADTKQDITPVVPSKPWGALATMGAAARSNAQAAVRGMARCWGCGSGDKLGVYVHVRAGQVLMCRPCAEQARTDGKIITH